MLWPLTDVRPSLDDEWLEPELDDDECEDPLDEELDDEPRLTEPPELPLGGRVELAPDATAAAAQASAPSEINANESLVTDASLVAMIFILPPSVSPLGCRAIRGGDL